MRESISLPFPAARSCPCASAHGLLSLVSDPDLSFSLTWLVDSCDYFVPTLASPSLPRSQSTDQRPHFFLQPQSQFNIFTGSRDEHTDLWGVVALPTAGMVFSPKSVCKFWVGKNYR